MENRAVLAAVLMAALLILYQVFFIPATAPPPPARAPEGVSKPVPLQEKTATPPAAFLPAAKVLPRLPERTVSIDTPLYHAIVGSEGGRLLGWTLHYRGEKVLAERGQMGLGGLILERPGVGGQPVEFSITGGPVVLDGKAGEGTLVMTGEDAYGVRVRETATFRADQYAVDLSLRLENGRRVSQTLTVALPWIAPVKPGTDGAQWPSELVWQVDGTVHREPFDKATVAEETPGDWAGLDSLYYLTALIPKRPPTSPGLSLAFGKVGEEEVGTAAEAKGTVRSITPEELTVLVDSVRSVIIVPGYGMAVAQAQHGVSELAKLLSTRGIDVKYAIHPVAGRMPGHMNVLLAEANVPYDQLYTMEQINPYFPEADIALVVGANDVTNPAAKNNKNSPLYGMPILEVDRAKSVIVLKRSLRPGFAGVDNELYYDPKCMMLFGDAKESLNQVFAALKS